MKVSAVEMNKSKLITILSDQREQVTSRHMETLVTRREEGQVEVDSPQAQIIIGVWRRSSRWRMTSPHLRRATARCGRSCGAAEALHCENLTIITAEEEGEIEVAGHTITITPAWRFLLG